MPDANFKDVAIVYYDDNADVDDMILSSQKNVGTRKISYNELKAHHRVKLRHHHQSLHLLEQKKKTKKKKKNNNNNNNNT